MRVAFEPSARSTLGVEVELAIIDARTGGLASRAPEVLAALASADGSVHPKVKQELFACTIEVITGICGSVGDARADLEATLAEVRGVLEPRGLDLLASGMHPFSHWAEQSHTVDPRYAALLDRLQWPAQRLLSHGVHYHVGVRSPGKAIDITNAVTGQLPLFLALSASSPFWHARDTGLVSVRSKLMESLPRTGPPPYLADWAEFESLMGALVTAGAISTVREVWWDMRPHPDFGTVELRMCDTMPTLREVCALAAMAQSLVEHCDRRLDRGETLPTLPDWVLRENKWRAVRYGMEAQFIVDASGGTRPCVELIEELVGELGPVAEDLGCARELADVLRILDTGSSADRQRRVLADTGSVRAVVDALRTEQATDTVTAR
ncbi:MAG: glutamate--cysteine ligase [Actinomycetota bacterium]|nr:glutamate--cysteine ligase [Actinomycetota bacterium]